jgi:alpha-amylase
MTMMHSKNSVNARTSPSPRSRVMAVLAGTCIAAIAGVGVSVARANDNPVFLQWFETSWSNIENRAPDLFVSGYGALWLPQPGKASEGSVGYDVFDRFDLGSPESQTAYGTESRFRQMVNELKLANQLIHLDYVANHNGGRTSDRNFILDGAYPGFYLPGVGTGAAFWGDFHDGTEQSQDPGGANYDLFEGDLVSLIDINQASNNAFIRHPIGPNAQNLPPGRLRNLPNPNNARLYPDRDLAPLTFVNFGVGGGGTFTIYPYNKANPLAGDPVVENATGLLMRNLQWYIDEYGIDGYRLDAAKHVPQWFWNTFYDAAVFNRRIGPDGIRRIPFSFGESVAGNDFVQTYIRKDGFGNRDALDLNEAGGLRDVLNARGLGSWQGLFARSIDSQDDGFNNGSQGVHHVFSHDNGSVGNGGSPPGLPGPDMYALPQNTWVLYRSGIPLIYHNGREMHTRFGNRFWAREGNPSALGNFDSNLQRLVQLHSGYVRGNFNVLNNTDPVNTSLNDVVVWERSNNIAANILVAVNDRYDGGFQTRNVLTTFPPGTRLRELSGAATDPVVNSTGAIPQVIVVGNDRRVTVTVPNNTNPAGVQHHRGYVLYAPAAPSGTVSVSPLASQIPADPVSVPSFRRRLTPMDVVTAPTFELRLDTTKTDPSDNNFDDFAVFRINQGWQDINGNGQVDMRPPGATVDAGYETFATQTSPISGPNGNNTAGVYRQTINTSLLPEGPNYISVIAYRRRTDGGLPIFREFRKVVYIDRLAPVVTLQPNPAASNGNFEFRVTTNDRTVNAVHIMANLPASADAVAAANASNQAFQYDRLEWRRNVGTLPAGANSLTVVAFELSGRASVQRIENVVVSLGSGDVNLDGFVTIDDLYSNWALGSTYQGEADTNRNNVVDLNDRRLTEQNLRAGEAAGMRGFQR